MFDVRRFERLSQRASKKRKLVRQLGLELLPTLWFIMLHHDPQILTNLGKCLQMRTVRDWVLCSPGAQHSVMELLRPWLGPNGSPKSRQNVGGNRLRMATGRTREPLSYQSYSFLFHIVSLWGSFNHWDSDHCSWMKYTVAAFETKLSKSYFPEMTNGWMFDMFNILQPIFSF